ARDVVGHDAEAVLGDDLAEHDPVGAGRVRGHADVAGGGAEQLPPEHGVVVLEGCPGLTAEVQVGHGGDRHVDRPLRRGGRRRRSRRQTHPPGSSGQGTSGTRDSLDGMPIADATTTSSRLLALLSLLQARRDWPAERLAGRLGVSERTVRRDVDRLRELGYPVQATRGPEGGYRLGAGSELPPLLFDDEQAVALAVALRTAVTTGADVEDAAARALATLRQVLPSRLRQRVDALELSAGRPAGVSVGTGVLVALSAAVRRREEVRFDYRVPGRPDDGDGPPRRVQPHHVVARDGRWYVVGWSPARDDWRVYRVDRMELRVPNGPRFTPREVPGGDVAAFLTARFTG